MGGIQNGARLTDSEAAERMRGQILYKAYSLNGFIGNTIGDPPIPAVNPCPENSKIIFTPQLDGAIAISGGWNALPRLPKVVVAKPFASLVKKTAKEQGVTKITIDWMEAYKIDLDGDNKDDYVIAAKHFKNGLTENSSEGDYSLVLVKRKSETILVASHFYLYDEEKVLPIEHTLTGILDCDGDGKMEIVIRTQNKEGAQSAVYQIRGDKAEVIFSCGCGM
jgi:hypothetical protein